MMVIPVLTNEEMREVDSLAIQGDLQVGYGYMQKAARAVFDILVSQISERQYGDFQFPDEIVIICGKGNNGGDGLVLAKLLVEQNYAVNIFTLFDPSELKGEAKLASEDFLAAEIDFVNLNSTEGSSGGFESLEDLLEKNKSHGVLVVDAILGTGVSGPPKENYAKVIELLNSYKSQNSAMKIVSIDLPSGSPELRIKADITVSLGYPKLDSYFQPLRANSGKVMVKSLGYPEELVEKVHKSKIYFPSFGKLQSMLPPRKQEGSKYDHGFLVILSGSKGMTGAPTLCSLAAYRSGVGMVHLLSPSSASRIVAEKVNEVILHELLEDADGKLSSAALDECLNFVDSQKRSNGENRIDLFCIGPGLGSDPEVFTVIRDLSRSLLLNDSSSNIPLVLDADGINAFAGHLDELSKLSSEAYEKHGQARVLITPHEGEFDRLFAEKHGKLSDLGENSSMDRIEKLRKISEETKLLILLKGPTTILANPEGEIYLLPFTDSSFAKAGTGDVLAGIISALAAQGLGSALGLQDAAILGSYLHGAAGKQAHASMTEHSMLASDIVEYIPSAILNLVDPISN